MLVDTTNLHHTHAGLFIPFGLPTRESRFHAEATFLASSRDLLPRLYYMGVCRPKGYGF